MLRESLKYMFLTLAVFCALGLLVLSLVRGLTAPAQSDLAKPLPEVTPMETPLATPSPSPTPSPTPEPAGYVRDRLIRTVLESLTPEEKIGQLLMFGFEGKDAVDEAAKAKRVVVIDNGKVAMDGTPRQVFARIAELKALGLTSPHTVELLSALNESGELLPLDAITVEECADAICRAFGGTVKE